MHQLNYRHPDVPDIKPIEPQPDSQYQPFMTPGERKFLGVSFVIVVALLILAGIVQSHMSFMD